MKIKPFTLIVYIHILFISTTSFGWAQFNDLNEQVPPNPTVASLMKAVITPVTEYAGIPNVSIPIHVIRVDGFEIPISLDYHMGGIQVGEESSNVGLGWSLNAGGIISRRINNLPDFGEKQKSHIPYINGNKMIPDYTLTNENDSSFFDPLKNQLTLSDNESNFKVNGIKTHFAREVEGGVEIDFIPDQYFFNINNVSGEFILTQNGIPNIINEQKDIQIERVNGNNQFDFYFTIKSDQGVTYEFSQSQKTSINGNENNKYISSWFLTKVITNKNNEIFFKYQEKGKSYPFKPFIQQYTVGNSFGFKNSSGPQSETGNIYLTEIHYKKNSISFLYSEDNERLDIPESYFLKNIKIQNHIGEVKQYDFKYTYFGGSNADNQFHNNNYDYPGVEKGDFAKEISITKLNPSLNLRLRLDSIYENDIFLNSFEYNTGAIIPNKTSMSQDYWGFYNGKDNYDSFIFNYHTTGTSIKLAKRHPIENKANLFSLRKIIHPTKGYTIFEQELNTYDHRLDKTPYNTFFVPAPPPSIKKTDGVHLHGNGETSKSIYTYGDNVQLDIILAIPYSNTNSSDHSFIFGTDMFVELYKGNELVRRFNIPSDQGALDFQQNGSAFYSTTIDLSSGEYTLKAYFNDHNQSYFGQVKASLSWEETQANADNGNFFVLGGGLRIKSISNYDSSNDLLKKRSYNYHYEEIDPLYGKKTIKSYGKIKELPNSRVDLGGFIGYQDGNGSTYPIAEARSGNNYSKNRGSYVGYDQVKITEKDIQKNTESFTIKKYYNSQIFYGANNIGFSRYYALYKFPSIKLPQDGYILTQEEYKKIGDNVPVLVQSKNFEYEINKTSSKSFGLSDFFKTSKYIMSGKLETAIDLSSPNGIGSNYRLNDGNFGRRLIFQFYPFYSYDFHQKSVETVLYFDDFSIVNKQDFYYGNNHYNIIESKLSSNDTKITSSKTDYPQDQIDQGEDTDGMMAKLVAQHRISEPIETTTYLKGSPTASPKKIATQKTIYKEENGLVVPHKIQTAKGDGALEDRIIFDTYDTYGNVLESHAANNPTHTVTLWGYNGQYPIARITNATLAAVTNALGVEEVNETHLAAINALRTSQADWMITTYEHIPLVGVKSITQPNGLVTYYEYDAFNRLKNQKDVDKNLLASYQYHYRGSSVEQNSSSQASNEQENDEVTDPIKVFSYALTELPEVNDKIEAIIGQKLTLTDSNLWVNQETVLGTRNSEKDVETYSYRLFFEGMNKESLYNIVVTSRKESKPFVIEKYQEDKRNMIRYFGLASFYNAVQQKTFSKSLNTNFIPCGEFEQTSNSGSGNGANAPNLGDNGNTNNEQGHANGWHGNEEYTVWEGSERSGGTVEVGEGCFCPSNAQKGTGGDPNGPEDCPDEEVDVAFNEEEEEERIFNELTGKALCVFEKLTQDNSNLFKEVIKVFIDDPKFNLIIKEGECPNTDDACTDDNFITTTGVITIKIEDTNTNPIQIASLILHEAIHAEIARYVTQYESNINVNDRPRLFQLFKYYKDLYDNESGEIDHIYMTERYINPIASALKQFDNNSFPIDYYKSLAWDGLRKWDANNILSESLDDQYGQFRNIIIQNSNICTE